MRLLFGKSLTDLSQAADYIHALRLGPGEWVAEVRGGPVPSMLFSESPPQFLPIVGPRGLTVRCELRQANF
jgi:hypothetical protein